MAGKGAWSINPVKTYRQWDWTKAYPSRYSGEDKPKWMMRVPSDVWIDEVRRGFKACVIFLWFPLYWLTVRIHFDCEWDR